jgi:4'-phosphopantetheinyl transferase
MPERYAALLDQTETERCRQFRFERDRTSYAISHALLRTTLSRYADVAPQDWRFTVDRYGKPRIAEPAYAVELQFNLSHTKGAALVGVMRNASIGVDVETFDRTNDCDALARRYFSPTEVAALGAMPEETRRAAFFEYWTLKEAYIKGRGLGLSLPLDQFSFGWNERRISISFDPRMNDRPEAWRFVKWRPWPEFAAAVAVCSDAAATTRFFAHETIPLIHVGEPVEIPTT